MSTKYKGREIEILKSARTNMFFAKIDGRYSNSHFDSPEKASTNAQYMIDAGIVVSDSK